MASRKTEDLVPKLRQKARSVVAACKDRGVDMLIICTLRDNEDQAGLYCQGRTPEQVKAKIGAIRGAGKSAEADALEAALARGCPPGRIVTWAGPGESKHSTGMAFDAVPMVGGKPMWKEDHPAWQVYGEECRKAGLVWAGDWPKKKREYPHAELA